MQMVNLTIDGKQIQAPAGSSVLEAARSAGIYIPTLCYHPDLRPEGACRLCITHSGCFLRISRKRGYGSKN